MTISVAWLRKVHNCEELVFVSDSRLCGGHRWDECPKIVELPGKTSALAFAGDTEFAYPMMFQLNHAMSGYRRIENRAMDVKDINGHLLNHANHLISSVYDLADPNYSPDIEFIYGGYSWVEKRFRIWRYYYDSTAKKMAKKRNSPRILHNIDSKIVIIGDQREPFKKELRSFLKEKYGEDVENISGLMLDMEPFEVLCRLLKSTDRTKTIGGAPQMIKVYQYMNSCPVGVYWPKKEDDIYRNRTLLGRAMFNYEDTSYWFIDPETLITSPCPKKMGNEDDG